MNSGTDLMRKVMRIVGSLPGVRLFRNNVGMGWVGKASRRRDGSVVIHNPRPLHAGLIAGSGDLIGWTEYEVKPDDVGRVVAIFTSIETKDGGRLEDEQRIWRDNVLAAGGIAGTARSVDDAVALIMAGRAGPGQLLAETASGTMGQRKGESRGRDQKTKTAEPERDSRETRS